MTETAAHLETCAGKARSTSCHLAWGLSWLFTVW